MPTPSGGYGRGKRGTHVDDAGSPNMPAKELNTQKDFGSSGKRGVHDSDHSDNMMKEPKEERRNVHQGGWFGENQAKVPVEIDGMRGHDPRRTHS